MAEYDGLDVVLRKINKREEWETLAQVADCKELMQYYYNNTKMVEEFNREIRSNFGHTLVNIFRGKYDPDYIEIVCEVADKLKIPCKYRAADKYDPWWDCYYEKDVVDSDAEKIEDLIIIKYFELVKESIIKEKGSDAWRKVENEMQANINKLHSEGKISDNDFANLSNAAKGSIGLSALVIAGELSGFLIYKFSMIALFAVSRALGLGLTVAGAGVTFTSALGVMLGPVGWGLTALSLLVSLGGTSWKKTIPSVFVIACLRKQQKYGIEESTSNGWDNNSWEEKKIEVNPEAVHLNQMGLQYDQGNGVPKDKKKAFDFFKRAAEMGLADAQCNLGIMYQYGQGVEEDIELARYWYQKAASQGLKRGIENLHRLG